MDKEHTVHIHSGILCNHRKNEILSFDSMGMTGEQAQKDKYHMNLLLYGI
jgi:hypothetical protein